MSEAAGTVRPSREVAHQASHKTSEMDSVPALREWLARAVELHMEASDPGCMFDEIDSLPLVDAIMPHITDEIDAAVQQALKDARQRVLDLPHFPRRHSVRLACADVVYPADAAAPTGDKT